MNPIGPETLQRLLAEHRGPLVLFARQWCATPEDVVQEAFLQLVRQRTEPDHVAAWLYRVVRNRAISAARSAGRRSRHEAVAAERGEPWFVGSDEQRLDAEAATAALQQLPVELRETVVARIWGGLSFAEIAELTGTSSSTAARRYQAGLVAMRERLAVECPPTKNSPPN
jgi:RNA polymerase sigma-70 factor (ECF subfamily)